MKFKFLDRERDIKYSLKDRDALRETFKKQAVEGDAATGAASFTEKDLPALLLEGLKRDDPTLTVEQIGDIVDMETFDELYVALFRALGFRQPEQKPNPTLATSAPGGPLDASILDFPKPNSGS